MKAPQKSLANWTKGKSGELRVVNLVHKGQKLPVNVIYLKRQLRLFLNKEYAATSAAKRKATRAGRQVAKQPKKIARKTARFR